MGLNMIVDNYANYGKCFGYNKDEQFSHFIQLYQADHKLIGLYPFKEQTYIPSEDYVTIQWM